MQKKRQQHASPQESRELLKSILSFMKKEQDLGLSELISIYDQVSPEESIPLSVFAEKLSPSEALCKFLKDNRSLSFHEIAVLLNRDDRSMWTSYRRASSKSKVLKVKESDMIIPISIFQDRTLSILEHVVDYMRTKHSMSNSKIAEALQKNPSSIATVAKRAEMKSKDKVKRK